MQIFNRKLLRLHRDKAAKNFSDYVFLYQQVGEEIIERITEISKNFSTTLLLGYGGEELEMALCNITDNLVVTDISKQMLQKTQSTNIQLIQADEEMLPFPQNHFDLVVSNLNMHFVNDLPGSLAQINHILKPGGIFIASLIGGNSLTELRKSLIEAETELRQNISPHISPMLDAKDGASLLQRANFFMPVSDSFTINVLYSSLHRLMQDLKGMGQSNCMTTIPNLTRKLLAKTEEIYLSKYSDMGKLTTSFEIVMLYGIKNGGQ